VIHLHVGMCLRLRSAGIPHHITATLAARQHRLCAVGPTKDPFAARPWRIAYNSQREEARDERLVFSFDGTWNRLDAAEPTNVVLTAESVLPLAEDRTAQLIFYNEGVGTARGEVVKGGLFGSGLVQNLADGYRFLIFNYSIGDEIFNLAPNYAEFLADSENPSWSYRLMNRFGTDRNPGPEHSYQVSRSAQKRWHEKPENLFDRVEYRPGTLNRVSKALGELDPSSLGIGPKFREAISSRKYRMYRIKRGDKLELIANRFYGDPKAVELIVEANSDRIDDADVIFAGHVIRLPLDGMI
jgi:hypothetical protein